MGRTLTRRNRKHPHNVMHEVGLAAKVQVRQLSNKDLDTFLTKHVANKETLTFVLGLSRGKKIKFIEASAMNDFNKQYKESQEKAKK